MYNIYNPDEIYVEWYDNNAWKNKHKITILKNEKELICFLAQGFYRNEYLPIGQEWNNRFCYDYYDGYGRIISVGTYRIDAWNYYISYIKGKDKTYKKYRVKNHIYKGTFRETPVEGISKKWRGGPSVRSRRIKHLNEMYANPEYKEFNRGSKKDIPSGWWDDWTRSIERNWKSQSKRKHQWKEKKGDNSHVIS